MTWAAFVKRAYQAARDWGMQPSEFWGLSPQEFWWEFDAKLAVQKAIEKQQGGKAGFTGAEWADARRRHKEKRLQ